MQYAGQCNKVLKEHTGTIRALAVIGDGQLASGGEDRYIKIWVCADVLLYCLVLCVWCHWDYGHAHNCISKVVWGHVAFAVFVLWFGSDISWVC